MSLSAREGQGRLQPPRSGAFLWTHGEARAPGSSCSRRARGSGLPALSAGAAAPPFLAPNAGPVLLRSISGSVVEAPKASWEL